MADNEYENKKLAYFRALRNAEKWAGGSVVIKTQTGYDAIPGAYLNDINYTGSRDVIETIDYSGDIIGGGFDADDLDDEMLNLVIDRHLDS
jgi:hypothetical protein